jgi:hypothetical protein
MPDDCSNVAAQVQLLTTALATNPDFTVLPAVLNTSDVWTSLWYRFSAHVTRIMNKAKAKPSPSRIPYPQAWLKGGEASAMVLKWSCVEVHEVVQFYLCHEMGDRDSFEAFCSRGQTPAEQPRLSIELTMILDVDQSHNPREPYVALCWWPSIHSHWSNV